MKFYPYASVAIPRKHNGHVAKDQLRDFWEQVEDINEGLTGAIGCYIFSIRSGGGLTPWYVGLAEKQSFLRECFQSHKLVHYNDVLASNHGTPHLTLIAKLTSSGKQFVGPTGNTHKDIGFLESMLITNCLSRNPELCNVKSTKMLREMVVPGLMNTPPGHGAANSVQKFKKLIGA